MWKLGQMRAGVEGGQLYAKAGVKCMLKAYDFFNYYLKLACKFCVLSCTISLFVLIFLNSLNYLLQLTSLI